MTVRGKVAEILNEEEVAFNVGAQAGVSEGDIATVVREVTVTDPDTREELGKVLVPRIRFRITSVEEKLSIGRSYDMVSRDSGRTESTASWFLPGTRSLKKIAKLPADEDWRTVFIRRGDMASIDAPPMSKE